MLSEKFAPTTQKSLFHKNIVNHIRKWIVNIEACAEDPARFLKHLLLITGPVGCGKSISMSVLLKGFNIINVDPNEVRSSEKIIELANTIPGFGDQTLVNIEKWNHKNKKEKPNIVVLDNIELCEKTISAFVDIVHSKRNVPIILIGNAAKYNDILNHFPYYTFIHFNKPSLLELSKLVTDINTSEKLGLETNNIRNIIDQSEFDVRQVFHILDQWKLSNSPFDEFTSSFQQKHVDTDLNQKVAYLLDTSIPFGPQVFSVAHTEPLVLTNGLYQNYITALENSKNTNTGNLINTAARFMDELSIGNVMQTTLFEDQYWELYDNVAVQSTVLPSFAMKQLTTNNDTNEGDKRLLHLMTPFKDISYNYMNSFAEVKQNCITNYFNPKFNKQKSIGILSNGIHNTNVETCFAMVDLFFLRINILTEYFDKQKKGKNTSKQEKLDICNNITDDNIKNVLNNIVDDIYHYHLFEIDIDNVIFNKSEYIKEDVQKKEYTKIDIRMLKRFLNIFSFQDTTKYIKPHVEAALKYKLFQKTVTNVTEELSETGINKKVSAIESLTEDLSNIWNF